MNSEKGRFFTIATSDGKSVEYEILFTFDSDDTKKSYIIFTDNNTDQEGSIITYAATYDKNGEELKLSDIKTDKEWDLIEKLLSQIEEKINEE